MPDFDSNDLHNTLTGLKSDTARVGLANAADVRRRGDQRTRATAAVSGLAALAVVAGAVGVSSGLGDSTKRAYVPPAAQPKLSASSLLIADEMPLDLPGVQITEWKSSAPAEGEGEPVVARCQDDSLEDLGAEEVWQRTFTAKNHYAEDATAQEINGGALGDVRARQVVAQFASAERAAAAMRAIDGWFDNYCSLSGDALLGWPDVRADGGRARLVEYYGATAKDPWNLVGYGLNGNAITIVTHTLVPTDVGGGAGAGMLLNPTNVQATLRFALQRIAGSRTTTANAVPENFRFAEERRGDWVEAPEPGEDFGRTRSSHLASHWQLAPCAENPEFDLRPLPSDALRTGSLLVRVEGPGADFFPFRQLALYADEATAKGAAQELVEEYARCANTSDEDGRPTTWTTERVAGPHDVTLATGTKKMNSSESFTRVVAILHRGNAVLVAFEAGSAESPVVQDVRKAVADNVDLICEVADCE